MSAEPVQAADVEAAPQWAVDMLHKRSWQMYVTQISIHNGDQHIKDQNIWFTARMLNASAVRQNPPEPLAPLHVPQGRIPIPDIPPPPVAGAPSNLPPPYVSPEPSVPRFEYHEWFPKTLQDLRNLTVEKLAVLFETYGYGVPEGDVTEQREIFADFIGVDPYYL
ncbi:hypothetical protein R3P38DRAFT_3266623 [Favolaschia claudopus]|uniref:Acrosin n=1 Tax=Favolaschia claudopus TaxID=2862362 RepID=A0AAW0BWW1_9AGAR